MKTIVAVDKFWGIGRNNDLLFKIPADMAHFKANTIDKCVVMGSNTLASFPNGNPLPKRTNIVLFPGGAKRDDCIVVDSLDELSKVLKNYNTDDTYVIGGAMFYHTMLPYCDEALITKIDADGKGSVFFDNLDETDGWEMTELGEKQTYNDVTFRFCTYKNGKVKEF